MEPPGLYWPDCAASPTPVLPDMTLPLHAANFLPDTASWAFFFDLDGTLAPLAQRPDLARVPEATIHQLAGLQQAAGGALAVISGRPLDALDTLLQPLVLPLGAEHGAIVRHADGRIDPAAGAAAADAAAAPAAAVGTAPMVQALSDYLAGQLGEQPGILLERKAFGLAVHYRLAPHAADTVLRMMESAMARFPQFELLPGKMVVEAKLPGVDKGRALLRLMRESPFTGRKPLMVGDDVTDETAFRQANTLGGGSIKIGAGDTCAALRLDEQQALSGWLDAILRSPR